MLQRPGESNEWQPGLRRIVQPHDDDDDVIIPRHSYFGAARFYCVETITAPCGVVIAWVKFDRSESPTNILNCWNRWEKTTRFIVDSYHYINHRTLDYLCRKWCNPGPLNGSAPNLVQVAYDKNGQPYFQRAFNTQACEQFHSWLGGFESILKRMKSGNFDWFLHTMLFYHTQHVIRKQAQQEELHQIIEIEDDEGGEEEEDVEVRHWAVEEDN
ncbi:hypothetical protein K443DRAFT_105788 [Laccaria amethystina LaAM-08-1]|uniref:Uncharacterized protein n=1 Tax=Laccaria amethystina LaAM-08-1 TaxID=1095629 RepID=A0A0C9WLL1_9AGAR|nr:hypothetical protein K443DRAFT_105788 [Laccaria amethystina LaAM-08-1]